MAAVRRFVLLVVALLIVVSIGALPAGAQGGPPNDDFPDRINLGSATPVTAPASTVGAVQFDSDEPGGVPNEPGQIGRFVWWTWQAPSDGQVRVFTEAADFFSALWVYTGNRLSTLAPVDGVSMVVPDRDSGVEFVARAGQQYQIGLGAEFLEPDFDEGTAVFRIELVTGTNAPPAPTITDIVANEHQQKFVVTFTAVRNAKSYEIQYVRPGFTPQLVSVPRSPGHVQGAFAGFPLEVQVRGVTARGIRGAWSDPVIAEAITLGPFAERVSGTVIEFGWTPIEDVTEYRLYLTDLDTGRQRLLITTDTALTFSNAIPGRSYEFEVWAMRGSQRIARSPAFVVDP